MVFTAVTIIILLLLIIVGYNSVASLKWDRNNMGEQYKQEAQHYYWYFIYYNPDDPRLIKPRGGGYTINFGRPIVILITVLIVGGYILAIIYG